MTDIKITAELVKELRQISGASIMECRNALIEAKGDLEKAIENLRKRGKEKAAKKANRMTAEGQVRQEKGRGGKGGRTRGWEER